MANTPPLREADWRLRRSTRDVAVERIYTVPEAIESQQRSFDLIRQTLESFALLGAILAAVSLYGVISNIVVQRTGEFGIRLALGAQSGEVLRLVLARGLRLTPLGLTLGLFGGVGVGRLLTALMPRVNGTDLVGLAMVSALLFLVTVAATWLPARRATMVDPLLALRAE